MYSSPYSHVELTPDTGELTHGPIAVCAIPSMVGISLSRNYTLFEQGTVLRLWFDKNGVEVEVWLRRLT
jgi:hypothetical protein